jgi:hypothetical protein
LEQLVAEPGRDNGQTRRLSGYGRLGDHERNNWCPYEMLDVSLNNIDTYFNLVGATDLFDETILLWKDMFDWKDIVYVRRNATEDRPTQSQVSRSETETILAYNELDMRLYQYVRKKILSTIESKGLEFGLRVRKLREANYLATAA